MEILKVPSDPIIPVNKITKIITKPIVPVRLKLTRLLHINLPKTLLQPTIFQQELIAS